ncbi:hypothetical protein IWZ01DRAFT_346781 [Phyllosticta capitalensis]
MATTATPKAFPHDEASEHNASASPSSSSSSSSTIGRSTATKNKSSSNTETASSTHDGGNSCSGGGVDPARTAAACNFDTTENTDTMNVADDDDAAAASLQLQSEQSIQLLRTRRPLLHHLHAGPSWLLQLPRPVAATRRGARGFYNVLINPRFRRWKDGEKQRRERGEEAVVEGSMWVARAMGRGKSLDSIEDVQELVGEIERLTTGRGGRRGTETAVIDAVVVSTLGKLSRDERDTLAQIDPDVPIFALEEAVAGINALDHFRHVSPIPPFSRQDPDWRAASLPPLPEWLAVSRLESLQSSTEPPSSCPLSATSTPPALLFAFAVPSPPCTPSSRAAPSKTQARAGGNSARALLHHNGWAPVGSASEGGAECIVFAAGNEHARDQHAAKGKSGQAKQDANADANDDYDDSAAALLSPDAIRAITYACPSLTVAAVMAPGVHAQGFNRRHARAQRLLRARYFIDAGCGDDADDDADRTRLREAAARSRRSDPHDDAWVRVHGNAGAGAHAPSGGAAARWYTPWRWPGAGVRWLTGRGGGEAGGDGRARGKKRGLDESDEEDEDEEEDELSGEGSENEDPKEALADEAAQDGVEIDASGPESHERDYINDDDDETVDPWAGVRRCRLGGGESILLS